jgi:hypothetical protein
MLATVRAARMLDCSNHSDATFAFHEVFPKCLHTANVKSLRRFRSIRPRRKP